MVAEVNNTFGERRPYLLEPANEVAGTRLRSHVHPKELHVSPFFGMDQTYRFFLSEPGERLTPASTSSRTAAGRSSRR